MPKYQHSNFGDVQNHIHAKGVITAVDSENDLADVTVEGYQDGVDTPLFYHCEPDSEQRSNGAIYGAAAAFSVDDEVRVMLEVDGAPVRILGFVDGIKSCYWEPWDSSDSPNLCLYHTWKAYDTGHSWVDCPADLYSGTFGSYTFTNGQVRFSGLYPGGGSNTILHATLRWLNDLTTAPASGVTECQVAITVTTTEQVSSLVRIQVRDSDGGMAETTLTSAIMDTPTTIDLSTLNGDIVDLYIRVETRGDNNTVFLLDYINFK